MRSKSDYAAERKERELCQSAIKSKFHQDEGRERLILTPAEIEFELDGKWSSKYIGRRLDELHYQKRYSQRQRCWIVFLVGNLKRTPEFYRAAHMGSTEYQMKLLGAFARAHLMEGYELDKIKFPLSKERYQMYKDMFGLTESEIDIVVKKQISVLRAWEIRTGKYNHKRNM